MRIDDPRIISEKEVITSTVIDWNLKPVKTKTLTGNIVFTDANLPQGIDSGILELHITGNFSIEFPSYWAIKGVGVYDGTKSNMIVVTCVDGTPASEVVKYQIIPDIV
jgi:hypothetical protein